MERRFQDNLSRLKKDILVLQTTSELLRKAGLRESEVHIRSREVMSDAVIARAA